MKKLFFIFFLEILSLEANSLFASTLFPNQGEDNNEQNPTFIKRNSKIKIGKDGFAWCLFEESSYIGAMNIKGDSILIPAYYSSLDYYNDGCFIAETKNRIKTLYSKTGELLLQDAIIQIQKDDNFQNAPYILYTTRNTCYVMNSDGKIIVPEDHYSYIFLDGLYNNWFITVGKDGYMGIVDKMGKAIIRPDKYHIIARVGNSRDGYSYSFRINGDNVISGVCDDKGKELIRTNYVHTFMERSYNGNNIFKVVIGQNAYELDANGEPINKPNNVSDSYGEFRLNNSLYKTVIKPNGKIGVEKNGRLILPCDFDIVGPADKFILVKKGNFQGAYTADGKCIIPPSKYSDISVMKSYFNVKKNGNCTCVNFTGREMCPFDALRIIPMIHGRDTLLIKTSKENYKKALYTYDNKQIIPFLYDNYNYLIDDKDGSIQGYYVFVNNTVGVCDLKGNEIIEPIYSDITVIGEGKKKFIKVISGDKVGVFDLKGNMIITPELFNDISFSNNEFIATGYDRICTFKSDGSIVSDSRPSVERDNNIKMADEEFDKSNWEKAAEYYGKAISYSEEASLYFNRGISYYNDKKYNQAINDLKQCIALNPSQGLFDKSRFYIAKARELLADKNERKEAVVSNVLGLVFGVASAITSTYNQHNHQTVGNIGNNIRRSTSRDYLLNPAYAMQQVQHENWREYMTATDGGRNMSYDDWYALKAKAWAEVNNNSSMSSPANTSTSQSSKNAAVTSNSSGSICTVCRSSGVCRTCDGHGYYYNMFDGRQKILCPNCYNHNGKCSSCGGSGRR